MNKKTKAEPEPGIAGDGFRFLAEIQLPEIRRHQEDHKDPAADNNHWLQVQNTRLYCLNDHQRGKKPVKPSDTLAYVLVLDLCSIQVRQYKIHDPEIHI